MAKEELLAIRKPVFVFPAAVNAGLGIASDLALGYASYHDTNPPIFNLGPVPIDTLDILEVVTVGSNLLVSGLLTYGFWWFIDAIGGGRGTFTDYKKYYERAILPYMLGMGGSFVVRKGVETALGRPPY